MRVLITGADGFIGRHLVRTLLQDGHAVVAACRPGTKPPSEWNEVLEIVAFELADPSSVGAALQTEPDAIVHLAAVAYSPDAEKDPTEAWNINAAGTQRLLDAARAGAGTPLILVTSSADVYAEGEPRPRLETDETRPLSVYAASKLGVEAVAAHAFAAGEAQVIIVRPFPATGPGQTNRLIPNWLAKLRSGQQEIEGDPTIVRDFTDVRDTAAGFAALLAGGHPGEIYNISSGREIRFGDLFAQLTQALGVNARLIPPASPRQAQRYLVGDSGKLRQHTGWQATIPLRQTLVDMISYAEAN